MAQSSNGRIEVGNTGSQVRLVVGGRATHLISQPLREFAALMIRRGYRDFVADLADCVYIDSTFAGVLAGISLKLKEVGGSLTLQRAPDRCHELLTTLGLEPLFVFDGAPLSGPPLDVPLRLLPMAARSREAWAGTILEAHKLLAQTETAHDGRFEDVVEFLEKSVSPVGRRVKFRN